MHVTTPSITINVKDRDYSFELGTSRCAQEAINSYKSYQAGHRYEDLKNCFASLHHLVKEAPEKKLKACKASHTLAVSVFNSETNIYNKFFIANSVSSIIVHAGLSLSNSMSKTKATWDTKMNKMGLEIQRNGLNEQAAIEAGLHIMNIIKPEAVEAGFDIKS